MSVKGFLLKDGTTAKYDYEALDNLPTIPQGEGLSDEVKRALLALLEKVAYIDANGDEYYDNLELALYPPANLVSISAAYTQSGNVYDTDFLNSLKTDLVVVAHYDNSYTEIVTTYTLSGTLTEGTSTITVSYGGKATTFNVTVTHAIDYTLDALVGVTWTDGYTYNKDTGELTATTGEHCTEKFRVQDCTYTPVCSDGTSSYIAIFMWDENDDYCGCVEVNSRTMYRLQLKPLYKYALKLYNTGAFDSSKVTMLPVNKTATMVSEFSISLSDYINDFAISFNGALKNGGIVGELDITNIFTTQGISVANMSEWQNAINNTSEVTGFQYGFDKLTFTNIFNIGILWYQSHMYLQMNKTGITTLTDLKTYITDNNIEIRFNY